MKTEKQILPTPSRTIQAGKKDGAPFADAHQGSAAQAQLVGAIQRQEVGEDDELLQGKFAVQRVAEDDDTLSE